MYSMHYVISMYTLMYLQATCVTEYFITHYSERDAPQYGRIDVLADVPVS